MNSMTNYAAHKKAVEQILRGRLSPAVEDVSDALEDFDEAAETVTFDATSLQLYDKTLGLINALRKAGLLYTE